MPEISTDELMRRRFHDLRAEIESAEKAIAPLRRKRDALLPKLHAIEAEVREAAKAVREAEAPLFDKNNEIARLSRALGGKTALSE